MHTFFDNFDEVIAIMSEKKDGDMKIRDEQINDVIKNRKKFCQKNNIDINNVVSAYITHSNNVATVTDTKKQYHDDVDALVTNKRNIYLSLTTADCVPVLFYDTKAHVIGIAHAGWRGVVAEIVINTLDDMIKIGAHKEHIQVEIGPCISQKNFVFGLKRMQKKFGKYNQDKYITKTNDRKKIKIDLKKIICDQISEYGVQRNNIKVNDVCTFDNKKLFSARRHGNDSFGAMMTIIGLKK